MVGMPRALDTSEDAYQAQLAVWRRLGPSRRLELGVRLSDDARGICMDGIRQRHPEYTEDEVKHALFRLVLGDELYRDAWPGRPLLAV